MMARLRLGWIAASLAIFSVAGCAAPSRAPDAVSNPADTGPSAALSALAEDYVHLSLEIGEREDGYIDAYYGPEAWQEAARQNPREATELALAVGELRERLDAVDRTALAPDLQQRQRFLRAQLIAAATRLRMIQGETLSFRQETLGLFGATPDLKPLSFYNPLVTQVEALLPGEGPLSARVDAFRQRFTIPSERLQSVFDAAIDACKARTERYIELPDTERFTLSFVTDKPWSGYNWYQGDYHSLIQVNTDLPIRIDRAIDLGCHEGYPGHHVFNMLLEKNLTREKGWVEFSVYPLYSPQSLIAEGSANYGIELAFPGEEKLAFERDTLYPLAGLDPKLAEEYGRLQSLLAALSGARFTIAQQYLDGEIDRERAEQLTRDYLLVSPERAKQSIRFNDTYRGYVINYGLGRDLVRDHIARAGSDPLYRWGAMEELLSNPVLPADLKAP